MSGTARGDPMLPSAASFGPYLLTRPLGDAAIGPGRVFERTAALHERDQTSHVVYRTRWLGREKLGLRRFLAAVEPVARVRHAHLLAVDAWALSPGGGACLVCPFAGDHAGLTTLADLVARRGGGLPEPEAARAIRHILEGIEHAHARAVFSGGALDPRSCLVDRAGRVVLELYGLEWTLNGRPGDHASLARSEVHSVVVLACEWLTSPAAPSRPPREATPKWREWLAEGLKPGAGFASATEALAMLPDAAPIDAPPERPADDARGSRRAPRVTFATRLRERFLDGLRSLFQPNPRTA